MNKIKYIIIFVGYLIISFLFGFNTVKAAEVIIGDYPFSTEIVYGSPLFESVLMGGSVNVDGKFKWVDELAILEAGERKAEVVFIPNNSQYEQKIIEVDVTINKRRVYLKFEEEIYKQYDEGNSINLPNFVVNGIIDKSVYVRGKLKGVLNTVLVGENINVNLSGLELEGDKKDNYYLDLIGYSATIYPRYIEKFGEIKNRIDFGKDVFVPVNSLIYVDKINSEMKKDNYVIKEVYDVYVKSKNIRLEIDGKVSVKIKIDESSVDYKRMKVYNYYNGEYEEISYTYSDGYLIYNSNGLGMVIIAQRKLNFWCLYTLVIILMIVIMWIYVKRIMSNRKKINKYKSLKRSKDNGDY